MIATPGVTTQRKQRRGRLLVVLAAATLCLPCHVVVGDAHLQSPGGVVEMRLASGPQPGFELTRLGEPVVTVSEMNLYVDGIGLGSITNGKKARVASVSEATEVKEEYTRFVPHRVAISHYNEYLVGIESAGGRTWRMEVRLFDDGAAYRLRVPIEGTHRVDGDYAAWDFAEDATIWRKHAGNRSYEDEYKPALVRELGEGHRFMMPVTVELPQGGYAVLTEANLVDYGDLALQAGAGHDFRHTFHDCPEGWSQEGEVVTPWRTVIAVGDLNELVNSDLVANLCPPADPSLTDAAWIRPGRCLWHWLGMGRPQLEAMKRWIDGGSALGWEYFLIDDGWRDWNGGGDAAGDAMKELVEYAAERDVALWAWVHSQHLRRHDARVAYFERAKNVGLVGLKIDFPEPANRDWVNWYDETLRDAANAQLLINFHGSVKPTGRERTWPHELTREAIRGREQGKLPASHDTALPFIRFVQGHADYTPTRLVSEELRGSTFAHELAMAIVYSSPLLCMGGTPEEYLSSDAVDVLKALPSTWDETVVLPQSRIGKLSAFARRSGDAWFIGVIGGAEARSLEVSTDFLDDREYACVELADKPRENATFARSDRVVSPGATLTATLSQDGGYVAYLHPTD